jgi:iodotyrosine deiodinase
MAKTGKEDIAEESAALKDLLCMRRSVRRFSDESIPLSVMKDLVAIAGSAPSAANMRPWSFILIGDPAVKAKIRAAAEEIERDFYKKKISDEWRQRLVPLNVDWQKPFLTEAPWLTCVFIQNHGTDRSGNVVKHYYPRESVGIAAGFFITAIHQLGLATLTYTPASMDFLTTLLKRPRNEKPFMILPVGYPHPDFHAPDINHKAQDGELTIM